MVYETFLQIIRNSVQEQMGKDYGVTLRPVLKNNGIALDSLNIRQKEEVLTPAIYLNPYYENYKGGSSIKEIVEEICQVYQNRKKLSEQTVKNLSIFEEARNRIVYKLISIEKNQLLLADIPYIPILDLAMVFYMIVGESSQGQMTSLIHHEHLDLWDISEEELIGLAKENSPRLLPPKLGLMEDVLKDIARANLAEDYSEEVIDAALWEEEAGSALYVLSNQSGINGAACILYPGILKNFADTIGHDLVILPSSIHEVLLSPYDEEVSFLELNDMIKVINSAEVPPEDRLSNHVYYYSRSEDRLMIPVNSSVSSETTNPPQR